MRFQRRFISTGLVGLFIVLLGVAHGRAQVRVWLADENRRITIDGYEYNNIVYGAVTELGDLLKLRSYYNPANHKLVLYAGAHALKVTADNPFLQIDDRLFQMPLPVQQDSRGRLYVPLIHFLRHAGAFLPGEIHYDAARTELHVRRHFYNITGIDVEARTNGHLIRLTTGKTFKKEDVEVALNRDWLIVTFVGGSVDTLALASSRRRGIVKRISPFQFEKAAQVSFQLSGKVQAPELFVQDNEILVGLREDVRVTEVPVTPVQPEIDRKKWLFDTIVLDPGHGGSDPGTVKRRRRMHEKDIVLDICVKLKALLERNLGVKVLMTRTKDVHVDLEERTKFANRHNANLFVSMHVNSNNSASARGFSVYVMGKSKTEEAQRVAEKENSVTKNLDQLKELQGAAHILNVIARNAYLRESLDLGQMMSQKIKTKTKFSLLNNPVRQGPFMVLWRAAMPSVLVETAMMSNRYDENLLNTGVERMKIAQALYEAIAQFKKKYEEEIG